MNANAEKSRQELAQISAFSSAQFIGPEKAEDEDDKEDAEDDASDDEDEDDSEDYEIRIVTRKVKGGVCLLVLSLNDDHVQIGQVLETMCKNPLDCAKEVMTKMKDEFTGIAIPVKEMSDDKKRVLRAKVVELRNAYVSAKSRYRYT